MYSRHVDLNRKGGNIHVALIAVAVSFTIQLTLCFVQNTADAVKESIDQRLSRLDQQVQELKSLVHDVQRENHQLKEEIAILQADAIQRKLKLWS